MMAGGLQHRIEIHKPTTSNNTFGERVVTYELIYTTRAEIVNNGGTRTTENNEVVLGHTKTFRVRKYVPIEDFCRIKYNGKFYRITNWEYLDKLQMLEIQTELVNE